MKISKTALILASLLLLIPAVDASSVDRTFAKTAVAPGETVTVTLGVAITGGETFYLIDDLVPSGWTVVSSDTGDFTDPGHVKWAVIQNAVNTSYTYHVRAPETAGRYAFSGKYMFERMTAEGQIGGQQDITVISAQPNNNNPPPSTGPGTDYGVAMLSVAAFSAAAILLVAYIVTKKSRGGKTKLTKTGK